MKAAIVTAAGVDPTYGHFRDPVLQEGLTIVTVTATALTNLTKGRASGSHYSANNQ
jgi:vacuolar-type H+-ATPase catalytic subunit A/Vma1